MRSPLFVSDLTDGIMASLEDPGTKGQIFEAMGPDQFLQADLIDWMHEVMYKTDPEWGYTRTDLRFMLTPWMKTAFGNFTPFGKKYYRGPTFERLERVNKYGH